MVAVKELEWVTEEQAAQLNELWEIRGEWREWLPAELDERWPEWTGATADELTSWLDELLPVLVMPADATDVRDLAWISSEQQAQLDWLWEVRGDWREWLPGELDGRWAEWTTATPEVLSSWLDTVIADLLLPPDASGEQDGSGEQDASPSPEQAAEQVVAQVATPALTALIEENPELAGMPPEVLRELLGQVVAERLASAAAQ